MVWKIQGEGAASKVTRLEGQTCLHTYLLTEWFIELHIAAKNAPYVSLIIYLKTGLFGEIIVNVFEAFEFGMKIKIVRYLSELHLSSLIRRWLKAESGINQMRI